MKTILACLTSEEHADDVLAAAIPLARRHMSHLIGFHTLEALVVYPGVAMHVPDIAYESLAQSQERTSKAIEKVFQDRVRTEDFASEWRSVNAQSTTASDRIVDHARACDLVVMAQADAAVDRVDQHHVQEQVIRQSGRPVLHVPSGYRGDAVGTSVVIGWSPTREAARAVHDAIPLMPKGAEVALVAVSNDAAKGTGGATEMARALDRHGFKVDVAHRQAAAGDVADVLEREALERGADLIVSGAFGHSRIYDFVIGAATLELLRSAAVPVLFAR